MKAKPLVFTLLAAVVVIAVLLALRRFRPAGIQPVAAGKNSPTVEIQDGKTIDFSSGKPVLKDSPQEKAIIDAAVKEMDDAAKNVTFAPSAPPAPTQKAAGPGTPPANP
jgi:hypothetical protein